MNNRPHHQRTVCKFNLRGMCRFGTRCWNVHEQSQRIVEAPQRIVQELLTQLRPTPQEKDSPQGACALSPNKPIEKLTSFNKENIYGPSTSSVEEAISLVKISESEEKTCGICFDTILKKVDGADRKFGILPNCYHCFCFTCIRKWRQTKEFESDVSKACPECRIASDYVYPSKIWISTKTEKDTFIDNHRKKLKQKDCGYFRKGKGRCPFGNTCLYRHALPDGSVLDVGPPKPRGGPRVPALDSDREMLEQILFWINDGGEEESEDELDDFMLDLNDPLIAMQYYDRDDIRRYMAMDRLMNGSDEDDDDFDLIF